MSGFDDLDVDVNAPAADRNAAIRSNAHIVNGGETQFPCPSCKGSGKFHAYTGRVVGSCFKCKGSGTVGRGVAAAAKGKVTRAENIELFRREHAAEHTFLSERAERGFRIASDMLEKLTSFGTLTEGQIGFVRKLMLEDAEKTAAMKIEREAAAPVVELSAIDALFAKATDNKIKRPVFRTETVTLKKASATGANPGALYVTDTTTDAYLGKLVNGKFYASRGANAATAATLQAIAADPTAEAIKYSRRTGDCGCCGRTLVDPVSILAGIGPICAKKWGLDFMRDLARTEYANIKADEIKRIKE